MTLGPGTYKIKIFASNKDGSQSRPLNIEFTILKPLWKEWWFLLLLFSLIAMAVGSYVYNQNRYKLEEQKLLAKISDLEKQALLGQMNPHFIFNAISAIQYFINKKDIEEADSYLSKFSLLIRKSLENSRRKTISLAEEIEMLRLYTQIEEKRFNDKFRTEFVIDEELESDFIQIPPMLIQPLVENAIYHGLMSHENGQGRLIISISEDKDDLIIKITDNGTGIKDAAIKNNRSLALGIINERIKVYEISKEFVIEFSLYNNEPKPGATSELRIKTV